MSLQRLLVYSPAAALVVVCLAVRVASDQTSRRHDATARASMPAALGVQTPRSVEAASSDGANNLRASSLLPHPPADVPGLSDRENTGGEKASGNEQTRDKRGEGHFGKIAADTRVALAVDKDLGRKPAAYRLPGQTPLRKPESWTPPPHLWPAPASRPHSGAKTGASITQRPGNRTHYASDGRAGWGSVGTPGAQWRLYMAHAAAKRIVARSARQRDVLAGTTEDGDSLSPQQSRLQLASRGGELQRTASNPADDPDFNPCAVPPSPLLLRLLTTLAGHSTPAHPLQILSLLRPPYRMGGYVHVGPANPHSMGLAVDIGAYGGYAIRQADGEACVAATLALLRDMPPGRYRLGMPKAPEGGWDMPPALTALLNRLPISSRRNKQRPAPGWMQMRSKLRDTAKPLKPRLCWKAQMR